MDTQETPNTAHDEFIKKIREFNGYNSNYEFAENERMTKENADKYRKQVQTERTQIKRPKPKKKTRRFTSKDKMLALIMAGVLAIGVKAFVDHNNQQNKAITYGQALTQMGERPETLGISSDDVIKMEQIKDKLGDENITDKEVKNVLIKLHSVGINMLESKVANVLNVNKEKLSFDSEYVDYKTEGEKTRETLTVLNKYGTFDHYSSADWYDFRNKNSLSPEISSQIKDIKQIEYTMSKIQKGEYDRKGVLQEEKNITDNFSRFAAMKLEKDENGNFHAIITTQKDLDNNTKDKENNQTKYNTSSETYQYTNIEKAEMTDDEPEL